ncbi:ATP-binding protein [Algoriphagus litoralis]|uniref:ATP-binding protein n=1 Tax=Algoriphagus litoralis TaxID=2202829 RepID=UPI000DB9C9A8|nr:ATP-binding protein [Algoriphagus litoralis]
MGISASAAFQALRSIPEFSNVPDSQLKWLFENSEIKSLNPGEFLFEPDQPIEWIYIFLEGTLDLYYFQGGNKRSFAQYQMGGILGYLPYSRAQKSIGYGEVTSPAEILSYPKSKIQELILHNPQLTEELVHFMVSRVRNFTSQNLQNEKMLALGKLSAGLTHELNNPIASINRDNAELHRLFQSEIMQQLSLITSGLDEREKEKLIESIEKWKISQRSPDMKPLEIRKLENDWLDRLEEWGVQEADEASEVFCDFGINPDEIQEWVSKINPELVPVWLSWIQFLLQSQALINNIQTATERIGKLIGAVKSYTHMDRAPEKGEVDLVKGIADTLAILAHKIKDSRVKVIFNRPESEILVCGYTGELNQIWTNLIDNAIDAMESTAEPTLEVRLIPGKTTVCIEFHDNGTGIPDEIQSKIFDPFFTTKSIGKGTGMGLDLVNQIVLKHSGSIRVESKPGHTLFKVELPKD